MHLKIIKDKGLNLLNRYISYTYNHYILFLIFFLGITIGSFYIASHLKLKSDFLELLPENYRSVQDLKNILARIGGTSTLFIAIESEDFKQSQRFAEDIADKLRNYPQGLIREIYCNMKEIKSFYENNYLLYMDIEDLEEIKNRITKKIEYEKKKANPFYIDFEDEKEYKFDITDLEIKYKKKYADSERYKDGYYVTPDGKLLVVIVKPFGSGTDVNFVKFLTAKIEESIKSLEPAKYHPTMKVSLVGNFKRTLNEYETLRYDLVSTALFCLTLVGLSIYLYYWKIRMVFLLSISVVMSIIWTFAIAYLKIGYLTSQTAFLGSIIIGNGINYGLILMARYLEERKKGKDIFNAISISIKNTWMPTFTAALSVSVSFGVLMIAQNRGFSQFGFIGGIGMIFCWIGSYTILPSLLVLSEKIYPVITNNSKVILEPYFIFKSYFINGLVKVVEKFSLVITTVSFFIIFLSIFFLIKFIPNYMDYDFTKLRSPENSTGSSAILYNKINDLFRISGSPAVILADDISEVEDICKSIRNKKKLEDPKTGIIDSCKNIYSFIPDNQTRKIEIIEEIKKLLDNKVMKFLSKEQSKKIEKIKERLNVKEITVENLPNQIISNFKELDGRVGLIAYVYPKQKADLWDGKNLIRFAEVVRENRLPSGKVIYSSGESVVYADMLKAISKDGPKVTILSFLAVILIVIINFRNLKSTLSIIFTLLIGVIWMGGIMSLGDMKLNFFNFIAIPSTFGIGVDYAVNLFQRYKIEGRGSIKFVLRSTGGAVILCSITTIIGYFALILAQNKALVSFGKIAILGEITCLLSAILFLPAFIIVIESRKEILARIKLFFIKNECPFFSKFLR